MNKIESIFNEREREFLHEAMEQKDMSAEATVRHFFRMGQFVDHYLSQGFKLAFVKDGEMLDPFDRGPKMAPMPEGRVVPVIFNAKKHINCACWKTGSYQRVEGCPYHPYDL